MSKFENKETRNEEIEKLKQQQLMQSILNRKNLENEALIQAVQESKNKTKEDIEKRKQQIIKDKLEEEKQKNQKEISEKLKEIENKRHKEQKSKEIENRIKEINKTDNEKLRKKTRIKEKNNAIVYQLGKIYKIEEKINSKKPDYVGTRENENIQKSSYSKENNANNINFPKEENNSTIEIVESKKDEKRTLENLKEQLINLFKGNIEKKKKKITNYRIIKGIKRYEENIRFYNQYQREKLFYKMNNYRNKTSSKKVTKNFKEIYNSIAIDHNLAIRNAEENKKSIQNERVS